MSRDLAPLSTASQQIAGPRPLPLFLELVSRVAETTPSLAMAALEGLVRYQQAPRGNHRQKRPVVSAVGSAVLRDCGGTGLPVVLVPSLINPPHILDLDPDVSLARALSPCGRVLLVDWGPAAARPFSVGDHVSRLLVPLLRGVGERPVLIGYCLGGTMALAAAEAVGARGVVTLASPWRFSAYPQAALESLEALWRGAEPAARTLGVLPMEVLQAAFWSLDPERTVAKFARLADVDPAAPEFQRFITLEDWANGGEALPYGAAHELVEQLFGQDAPGKGDWRIGGEPVRLPMLPSLHITAQHDRIVPSGTAAPGPRLPCSAGHVGMIVGREAPEKLHRPLREWLAAVPSQG